MTTTSEVSGADSRGFTLKQFGYWQHRLHPGYISLSIKQRRAIIARTSHNHQRPRRTIRQASTRKMPLNEKHYGTRALDHHQHSRRRQPAVRESPGNERRTFPHYGTRGLKHPSNEETPYTIYVTEHRGSRAVPAELDVYTAFNFTSRPRGQSTPYCRKFLQEVVVGGSSGRGKRVETGFEQNQARAEGVPWVADNVYRSSTHGRWMLDQKQS